MTDAALRLGRVLLAGGCVLWAGLAQAEGYEPCPGGVATVAGASPQDFIDICQGVGSASSFFAAHGVLADGPLRVVVTSRLPEEAGPTAAGCYIESKRTVYVVPWVTFQAHRIWFGVAIDRAMYRSLASHEAAHAIAACGFLIPHPTIQAKEYLAYVAMFSTMPPALRAQALAGVAAENFDSLDRFTPMLYLFDPMRFGAGAYRHYAGARDPASVIRAVLAGTALTD